MAVIERFLGKRVKIPEDRRYYIKQGLWGKYHDDDILFGLSEPALVLVGGLKDVDWIVMEGQFVQEGEAVIFAITGKILYIDSPLKGNIHFNAEIKDSPAIVLSDPYEKGWLFKLTVGKEGAKEFDRLAHALEYAESLRTSEGYKNPEGLKGGVSGICKAVYTGIGEQKL